MSQSIQHYTPQDGVFAMELPYLGPRKRSFGNNTNEKVIQTFQKSEKMPPQIKKDLFVELTEEIKTNNNWGNSFDEETQALMNKTNEFYSDRSAGVEATQRRKISRDSHKVPEENKENDDTPDTFANIEILLHRYEAPEYRDYLLILEHGNTC